MNSYILIKNKWTSQNNFLNDLLATVIWKITQKKDNLFEVNITSISYKWIIIAIFIKSNFVESFWANKAF